MNTIVNNALSNQKQYDWLFFIFSTLNIDHVWACQWYNAVKEIFKLSWTNCWGQWIGDDGGFKQFQTRRINPDSRLISIICRQVGKFTLRNVQLSR